MAKATSLIPNQCRQRIMRHLRTEQVLDCRQINGLLGISHVTSWRNKAVLADSGRFDHYSGRCHHPKFGCYAKYGVLSPDELDTVIRDPALDESDSQRIECLGVGVVRASLA